MATPVNPPIPPPPSPPPGTPVPLMRRAVVAVVATLGVLLLVDAAVETWLAASPARLVVAAAVTLYLVVALLLRRRLAAVALAVLSPFVLLGLLAFSAWQPGGLHAGVVMLRQPTSAVLAAATSLAIVLASWTLVRAAFLPIAARIAASILGVYAFAALALGITSANAFPELVHGQSLWSTLPFWLQGAFVGGCVVLPAGLIVQLASAIRGGPGGLRRQGLLLALVSASALMVVAAGLAGDRQVGISARAAGSTGPGLRLPTVADLQLPVARTPDLAHVAPGPFASALGKDPSRIFEFVRDQVAFEAYAGCLRGPRGTLMALAGNSVDRAALLASLLSEAGYRARFARGRLPDDRAQALVESIFAEPARRPATKPPAGPGAAAAERLTASVRRDAKLLTDSLRAASVRPKDEVAGVAALVDEARDHYWVQILRDGAWVDMDPSFASAVPATAYAQPTATFDALPEDLFHRVDITIHVEEYAGAAASTREVLRYSGNAADLTGNDLVLGHVGDPAAGRPGGQSESVRPVLLVRDKPVSGQPFRVALSPASRTSAGFGSFFRGGEEAAPPAQAVATAEFVRFEFTSPGGRRDSVDREIFDRVGPARHRKGTTLGPEEVKAGFDATGLASTVYHLFLTAGAVNAEHLANLPDLTPAGQPGTVDLQAALRQVNVFFAALSDRLLDRVTVRGRGVCRFYLDSPRVHVAQVTVRDGAIQMGLDLRRNRRRAVGWGIGQGTVFDAQVLRGVIDGHLERILVDYLTSADPAESRPQPAGMSTALVFDVARASNVPFALLEGDAAQLDANVPADGRARVDDSLSAGSVAFAPTRAVTVSGAPRFAWWQVDRRSGDTLAVTDEGLHQMEYSIIENRQTGQTTVFAGRAGTRSVLAKPYNFGNAQRAENFVRWLTEAWRAEGTTWKELGWFLVG